MTYFREKSAFLKIILAILASTISLSAFGAGNMKLNKIMSLEMIGVQRSFFERIAGTARYVDGALRTYEVGGCSVSISENPDRSVKSIGLSLSERCTFYRLPSTWAVRHTGLLLETLPRKKLLLM